MQVTSAAFPVADFSLPATTQEAPTHSTMGTQATGMFRSFENPKVSHFVDTATPMLLQRFAGCRRKPLVIRPATAVLLERFTGRFPY